MYVGESCDISYGLSRSATPEERGMADRYGGAYFPSNHRHLSPVTTLIIALAADSLSARKPHCAPPLRLQVNQHFLTQKIVAVLKINSTKILLGYGGSQRHPGISV